MTEAIMNREQAEQQSRELLAMATRMATEAGWTGAEDALEKFKAMVRPMLHLLERKYNGEFGPEPESIHTELQGVLEGKKKIDSLREGYQEEWKKDGASPKGAAPWIWDLRRAVVITTAVVLAATLLNLARPELPPRVFLVFVLAALLMAVRPWGIAKTFRNTCMRIGMDITYVLNGRRLSRIERQIEEIRNRLDQEENRRKRAERWVGEQMEWVIGHYEVHRARGMQARLMATQAS